MSQTITYKLNSCRICKHTDLADVIDLKQQVITSRWPVYGDFSTPSTPVCLCLCKNCGLVQLKETTNSNELYEYEYGYRSGISNTMRQHLLEYQREIISKVDLEAGDTILDIGSNDSTMLQYYDSSYKRIGCDPTGLQFKEHYGNVALIPTYFTYDNFTGVYGSDRKCKIVSSISMFYDLPDPVQFAKDIHAVLTDDGIWTCEQSYLLTMLRQNSIDTICHEHLEYYALSQVKRIADMSGFKIIDVSFNECNGGSFRVYFAKDTSTKYTECTDKINSILQDEDAYSIMTEQTYVSFMNRVDGEVQKLKDFISWVNADSKQVYIYGASTKGNCLLQYANLTEADIPYAVERNPSKFGKMTSTGIPIISEEVMRAKPPAYLLVLPWHFKDEILIRESNYLNNGGQFIFPFPEFTIVGNKPKVMITGCDGMIAKYVQRKYVHDSCVYGICHHNNSTNDSALTKITCDMVKEKALVSHIIQTIKPDVIIHLAGISSAKYALEHPIETLEMNGMLTARICDTVYQLSQVGHVCKLFNASSCEIYKGHETYNVKEDDTHKYHIHPYSIAKAMGHDMVKFYRERYNMPFVNGVLFTIESPDKRPEFLLNKVAKYLKEKDFLQPLQVGHLGSTRNILHASDTAAAIKLIMSQPLTAQTGDYNICGTESYLVMDLVDKLCTLSGIAYEFKDDIYWLITQDGRLPIIKINKGTAIGFDQNPTHINGNPDKLIQLGWNPLVSITSILEELIC
jgi:GDP-D-mannose dehydratase